MHNKTRKDSSLLQSPTHASHTLSLSLFLFCVHSRHLPAPLPLPRIPSACLPAFLPAARPIGSSHRPRRRRDPKDLSLVFRRVLISFSCSSSTLSACLVSCSMAAMCRSRSCSFRCSCRHAASLSPSAAEAEAEAEAEAGVGAGGRGAEAGEGPSPRPWGWDRDWGWDWEKGRANGVLAAPGVCTDADPALPCPWACPRPCPWA